MAQNSQQKIGIATATIIGMNAMIGSGIFTIPVALGAQVGPAGIITMFFVSFLVWFIALSLARVAYLFPVEGSFYSYAKQWGGHCMGVLAAGSYLIGLVIAMGLLSQMAGVYLQHYFSSTSPTTLGAITLFVLVFANMFGVVLSQIGQYILICLTVFPLIATSILCLLHLNLRNLIPFSPYGITPIFKASRTVIFSFFGFECAASLFAIVKDPAKNVPRALSYSLLLVAIIYIIFSGSIILSIPLDAFSDPRAAISDILLIYFPSNPWIIEGIHLSILSAIVGTIHSMIWSSSSLLISFVKQLKNRPAQFIANVMTPKIAVTTIGLAIFTTFSLIRNIDLFFNLTALFIVFAFATSIITLLTIKQERNSIRIIKVIIGLGAAALIMAFALEDLIRALLI